MFSKVLAAAVGLSSLAAATSSAKEPCGQISLQYETAVNKTGSPPLIIDGQLAHECLQSMPFDGEKAAEFIVELKKYLQWHSNIDILKNPPSSYLSPAVDILGGLDKIRQQALNNEFDSQYAFDMATNQLLKASQDGHLQYTPCSMGIFAFGIPLPLISVSTDGLQLPKIYYAKDGPLLTNQSHLVSPVVKINGKDAVSELTSLGLGQGLQDPDSRYNYMFQNLGRSVAFSSPGGLWDSLWQGQWPGQYNNTLQFANGSAKHDTTFALFAGTTPFDFANGQELWESACLPQLDADDSSSSSSAVPSSTPTPTPSSSRLASSTPSASASAVPTTKPISGYPKAVVREPNNLVSGYYLPEKDFKDVAVLAVPSFNAPDDEIVTFEQYATKFVKQAVAAGKKKLIIDLTANPGGVIDLGFDLFRLFFPKTPVYSATRMRSHEQSFLLGTALQSLPFDGSDEYSALGQLALSNFVSPNQTDIFHSWKQVYGPHRELGANMSSLYATNMTINSLQQGPISGYAGAKNNETKAPFAPEDLLIVTDGYCSSTCTIFSELMKQQGVKTLAFGGRPQYGPMQALGGTRGSQVMKAETIQIVSEAVLEIATNASTTDQPILSKDQLQKLNATQLTPLDQLPLPVSVLEFNFRNNYAPGNPNLPLQFAYQPADCRLFLTYENFKSPQSQWIAAARAFWGNGKCVSGSSKTKPSASSSMTRMVASATASA